MQMLKETRKKIPIFMYHSIGSIKRGEGLRSLHVSPLLFNIQLFIMKILKLPKFKYHIITDQV